MLLLHEHATLREASLHLLGHALVPKHWLLEPSGVPAYQARVGKLRITASLQIRSNLQVVLRVAFRAPGLTPSKASDHLEEFLRSRVPLQPNTEWQVKVDERHWIHFERPYLTQKLVG